MCYWTDKNNNIIILGPEHGFMVRRNTEYGLEEGEDEEEPNEEIPLQEAIDVLEQNLDQLRKDSE